MSSPNQAVAAPSASTPALSRFALLGNPNTGKTTLFNRLCGVRAHTANLPGSTVEARIGQARLDGNTVKVIDLPGLYGLDLDRPESTVCRDYLRGELSGIESPDAAIIILDSSNLDRNLVLASQALALGLPVVIALNMIDIAQRRGLTIDAERLGRLLGCLVIPICARSGKGVDELLEAMKAPAVSVASLPRAGDIESARRWAQEIVAESVGADEALARADDSITDRLDAAFTHPILGILLFAAMMIGLFYCIFALATVPMDLIELAFETFGAAVTSILPAGAIRDLLVNGVIAGIAGTVVFLPQICLLFFLISLLEDTGYLARAAFVMDRILRRFGLPGQAFIPMLSAHACAIPAIMSARLIPDPRDRLATILVAPFLSCSARLPVYVLLIGILFVDQPLLAGVAFAGCYALGALAAILSSLLARRTILRGPAQLMVLELPGYKLPSIRTALLTTWDRALLFLRKAGTVILGISIALWWLSAYPHVEPPAEALTLRTDASALEERDTDIAAAMLARADALEQRHAASSSFIGRIGHAAQPVFEPLGYDWQLTVGVLSSFAAREVFVSTMAVLITGSDDPDDNTITERLATAKRSDGTPVFTTATAASLLVFYVLAMQCLPTLAVTRREAGGWKWAALQLGYMSAVAYVFALITYLGVGAFVTPSNGGIT